MKTFYTNLQKLLWTLAILLAATVTLTSCLDEDQEIGNAVSGHWFGDMDMYYDGEAAKGSEIEFYTGWGFDHGRGVEIDYYARHAVTTHFDWEVRDRILFLTFEDPALDCAIVDYRLSYDYFKGYIADYYTLENQMHFSLRNYDRYWDRYGYGYYDSYYGYYDYYVKSTRAAADSTDVDSVSAAREGYRGVRGVNMKD